jgi:hypothetical protein
VIVIGHFAGILIEKAIRASEISQFKRPITRQEFEFASALVGDRRKIVKSALCGSSLGQAFVNSTASSFHSPRDCVEDRLLEKPQIPQTSQENSFVSENFLELNLNLSQFIVLELLRLNRVNSRELTYLKELFTTIDEDGSGFIDYSEVINYRKKLYNKLSRI